MPLNRLMPNLAFGLWLVLQVISLELRPVPHYCAERRLLQRIGGRYRFIHRELLDHFARL